MEIGTGLIIFFVLTTIVGVAMGLFFSVDGLSAKFYKMFEEEDRNKKLNTPN